MLEPREVLRTEEVDRHQEVVVQLVRRQEEDVEEEGDEEGGGEGGERDERAKGGAAEVLEARNGVEQHADHLGHAKQVQHDVDVEDEVHRPADDASPKRTSAQPQSASDDFLCDCRRRRSRGRCAAQHGTALADVVLGG